MIDDDQIEAALNYLAKNVEAAAEARANKIYAVEGRKVKKAQLMRQSNEANVNAQERYAYSHPEYGTYLEEMKSAIYEDAKHEFRRHAYDSTIEAWRTQQANIRTAERVR